MYAEILEEKREGKTLSNIIPCLSCPICEFETEDFVSKDEFITAQCPECELNGITVGLENQHI